MSQHHGERYIWFSVLKPNTAQDTQLDMLPMHGPAPEQDRSFERVSFVAELNQQLKSLSGWTKSHRIPEEANNRAQEFVANLSASELKQDLDSIYEALKTAFGFKRRELSVADPADGTGTITTPHFSYSVSVAVNPADMTKATWTRIVDNIRAPAEIVSPAFAEVFDSVFHTLQFALPGKVDLDDFIDAIEAAEIADVDLTYDRDATYCELRFAEASGAVRVTTDTLSIVQKSPAKVRTLIQTLQAMQALVHKYDIPLAWSNTND